MALALRELQPAPDRTERHLVTAVRAGDDRAFEQLFARYRRRIGAYVYGMVSDHARAEDITQEVFISALRRMRETETPIVFRPWIYEIARNACIDEFRRARRATLVPFEDVHGEMGAQLARLPDDGSPETRWERKQQLTHLFGAFSGLSDSHHRILVLRELEGLSYGEIAAQMGMSRPMVESTLFRARRRLSHEYDELASGRRCQDVRLAVDQEPVRAVASRGIRERRRIARHLAYCDDCLRYARAAGVDDSALRESGLARRVAALLPFGWLHALLGRHGAGARASAAAARAMDRASGLSDGAIAGAAAPAAAAAAALLIVAGLPGGDGAHHHHHLTSPRPASAVASPRHAAPAPTPARAGARPAVPARAGRPASVHRARTGAPAARHHAASRSSSGGSAPARPRATAPAAAHGPAAPAQSPAVRVPLVGTAVPGRLGQTVSGALSGGSQALGNAVSGTLGAGTQTVGNAASGIVSTGSQVVSSAASGVVSTGAQVAGKAVSGLTSTGSQVLGGASSGGLSAGSATSGALSTGSNVAGAAASGLRSTGSSVVGTAASGTTSTAGKVLGSAANAGAALTGGVTGALQSVRPALG